MGEYNISEAIKQFIANSRLNSGVKSVQIETIWKEVMGETIAKYTTKVEVIKNTLFITTHVGALKTELHFQKQLIIRRINEAFGEDVVKDLIIN